MQHMQQTKQKYLRLAEGQYLVLKNKTQKPSLNNETLTVLYKAYMGNNGRQCSDEEAVSFAKFVEQQLARLATTSMDLVLCKSPPVASFF